MSITLFIAMILSMIVLVVVTLCHIAGVSIFFGLLASALFVAVALSGFLKKPSNFRFFAFVFAGLIFSLCGDVFMAMNKDQGILFLLGVGCFAVAHLMYSFGYCSRTKLGLKDALLFLCFFVPVSLVLWFGGFSFGSMKVMVLCYAVIICFMLSKSFSMVTFYMKSPKQAAMLISGSILFFLSDVCLLFFIFTPNAAPILRQINWMLYYPGQGLLALSFTYALYENRKTREATALIT